MSQYYFPHCIYACSLGEQKKYISYQPKTFELVYILVRKAHCKVYINLNTRLFIQLFNNCCLFLFRHCTMTRWTGSFIIFVPDWAVRWGIWKGNLVGNNVWPASDLQTDTSGEDQLPLTKQLNRLDVKSADYSKNRRDVIQNAHCSSKSRQNRYW